MQRHFIDGWLELPSLHLHFITFFFVLGLFFHGHVFGLDEKTKLTAPLQWSHGPQECETTHSLRVFWTERRKLSLSRAGCLLGRLNPEQGLLDSSQASKQASGGLGCCAWSSEPREEIGRGAEGQRGGSPACMLERAHVACNVSVPTEGTYLN